MHEQILDYLAEVNPEAVILDGFNEALISVGYSYNRLPVAIYDTNKIIEILTLDMTELEAIEYFYHNISCAYFSEHNPIFTILDAYY